MVSTTFKGINIYIRNNKDHIIIQLSTSVNKFAVRSHSNKEDVISDLNVAFRQDIATIVPIFARKALISKILSLLEAI